MFETKKTLIVVYKDELLMNQLKKMVETHDDNEQGVVGIRADSINIVSWTEKVWLGNKKAGNIQGKILFLDEIKGTDKLIPVIDVKFDECGIKFGWAGNQAVVYADTKVLTTRKDYDAFLEKLSALPVPSFLKATKEGIAAMGADQEKESATEMSALEVSEEAIDEPVEGDEKKRKKADIFKDVKKAFSTGADAVEKVGNRVVSKSEEVFRNKSLMKRQMLFYGVVSIYNDGFEKFMNM
jgi:nicotinic acid phosphoribosyltransferase